ncbi:T9SS type A sorting domain-containing protein, partial [candidate division WOR-3 bacterium]|nr:T9SS type A sorting domain-containing protein [candidate division WOR-3 bacterium]
TPGSEIESITFWMRQPESAISWCGVWYDDATNDHIIAYPETSWTLVDLTSIVNPAKNVVRLQVYGYSGGGPDPDSSFLDDASIAVQGTGVLEPERTVVVHPPALTVAPNPAAGDFARLGYALPRSGPAEVTVLDVTGRCRLRQELAVERSGSVRLDLRGLADGVYLVRLEAAGSSAVARLVRQQ